jgi:hypothetical protein
LWACKKIGELEVNNKSLTEENTSLRGKLIADEIKLTTIECVIESTRQKSLQNTVKSLKVLKETGADALAFIKTYTAEIRCVIE